MNAPSSTITFAALAGMGMTVFWGLISTFTKYTIDPILISGRDYFMSSEEAKEYGIVDEVIESTKQIKK